LRRHVGTEFGASVDTKFKVFEEFRGRSAQSGISGAIESMGGTETAGVLLTLKDHFDPGERDRYRTIVSMFQGFYPRYTIEAVLQQPGSRFPEIQFYERNQPSPLPLSAISAGVHQVLTILTNVIGRTGLFLFLEHPEQHLHPHASRRLMNLLRDTSVSSQVIVATHDLHFVEPSRPGGIRRFWWSAEQGTQIFGLDANAGSKSTGQMQTALRELADREMVFARAVLLVEDESQQGFISSIAPTLGHDLDASGLSVVAVDGDAGYGPYLALLAALHIPHVALKDRPWGNSDQYPRDRFFSFGKELEDFLDDHGMKNRRLETAKSVGTNKRRVAGALGRQLAPSEIPQLFLTVLQTVVGLASGEPISQT